MKKFIGILVVVFLLLSLGGLVLDAKGKLGFKKVIWKTDAGSIEIPWELEFYFNESGKFSRAVIKSHPEVTWEVIPELEADYELPDGKYSLLFKVLDHPVEFLNGNGKKYSNRLTLIAGFTEASSKEIGRIPKLLLEAAKKKKPVIIKAKLTIKGMLRWTANGEEGLLNQGGIEILKITLKE